VGQVCVVKRSDGKMKFAVVKSRSASVRLREGGREGGGRETEREGEREGKRERERARARVY
jgi:hypothetical protein